MTGKVKKLVENLRHGVMFCAHCSHRETCAVECDAYQDAQSAADLIERLSRAFEAAKRDMQLMVKEMDECRVCLYDKDGDECECECEICDNECKCRTCKDNSNWAWRGHSCPKKQEEDTTK